MLQRSSFGRHQITQPFHQTGRSGHQSRIERLKIGDVGLRGLAGKTPDESVAHENELVEADVDDDEVLITIAFKVGHDHLTHEAEPEERLCEQEFLRSPFRSLVFQEDDESGQGVADHEVGVAVTIEITDGGIPGKALGRSRKDGLLPDRPRFIQLEESKPLRSERGLRQHTGKTAVSVEISPGTVGAATLIAVVDGWRLPGSGGSREAAVDDTVQVQTTGTEGDRREIEFSIVVEILQCEALWKRITVAPWRDSESGEE